MQLRVYDYVVSWDRKRPVAVTGYFLLVRGMLLTSQLPATSNYVRRVEAPLTTDENMTRIRAGYVRRYDELREGIIEEGKGLPVEQLPYARAVNPETLWPLVTELDKGKLKQIDPYDNAYRIFKGTLK